MKKLTIKETSTFASALDFTISEACDIVDLFYTLKSQRPDLNWRINRPLDGVDDYIKEWEDHWHRERNFSECFKYERDANRSDYDPENVDEIFSSEGAFRGYAMGDADLQFVYQLPNSDMVVVVC